MTGSKDGSNGDTLSDEQWLDAIRSVYRAQVTMTVDRVGRKEITEEVGRIMCDSWRDICSQTIARRFAVDPLTGFALLLDKAAF